MEGEVDVNGLGKEGMRGTLGKIGRWKHENIPTDNAFCSLSTHPKMLFKSTFPPKLVKWVSSPITSHRSNN